MMIFKSLCLQEPLLKSQEFVTCYAGRGLRSGVAVRGFVKGPAAKAVGRIAPTGYAAPKAPAGQSCLDGEYFNAWPCQYDIDLNRINDK